MALISVIVPVYNAEKTLRGTLDSILRQTFRDFEIILVDDGSTDSSPAICEEYAGRDSRIRVIHQENKGLSEARNAGIRASAGKCLTYVDSDDFLTENALEKWTELINRFQADMAIANMAILADERDFTPRAPEEIREFRMTGKEALEQMLLGRIHGSSACGLLLAAELARKHLFPPGKFHEDDRVTFRYYTDAERVAATTEELYLYIQRPGSITHRTFGQAALEELEAGDEIVQGCANETAAIVKAAVCKRFVNYCQVFLDYEDLQTTEPEIHHRIRKALHQMKYTVALNGKCRKVYRIYAAALILGGTGLLRRVHNRLQRRIEAAAE